VSGGYTLLQLLIEEVSGEPFAEHMRRVIFNPLGMASAGYEWTTAACICFTRTKVNIASLCAGAM